MLIRRKETQKKPTVETRSVGGQIYLIDEEKIVPNPYQPRTFFNDSELQDLAQSISVNGILQPLNVRVCGNRYELIAGERRLRAARMVGMKQVPCILICADDEHSAVLSIMENIQRSDLDCFEEAAALQKLIEIHNLSQEELSRKLGKAPSTISNKLRLLNLPEEIQSVLRENGMTERHARALLKLPQGEQLTEAVRIITEKHMTVSETERLVEKILNHSGQPRKLPLKLLKDLRLFTNTLNHAVDTMKRAGIKADSRRKETEEYIEYVVRIPKNDISSDNNTRNVS